MNYIIENGMRQAIPDNATLHHLREIAPKGQERDDIYFEGNDGTLQQVEPGRPIPKGAKITRVPEVVKGAVDRRLQEELEMLANQIRGRGRKVVVGAKRIDGRRYNGVIVKNFSLNRKKYREGLTDILFMLPENYPRLPALGVYMRFPHKTTGEVDHHQTLQAHYGAPELQDLGWYWYCVGMGHNFAVRGFSKNSDVHRVWKPGPRPGDGHNLTTLYAQAHLGINTP